MAGKVSDNWLTLAQDDLTTAQTMLETARGLLLHVGLRCHEAVRETLTAAGARQGGEVPAETDSLLRLVAQRPWKAVLDARMLQTLEWLSAYPILESEGVQDAGDLAVLLTPEKTAELLARTKELCDWIGAQR